jgi:hypothetical protein
MCEQGPKVIWNYRKTECGTDRENVRQEKETLEQKYFCFFLFCFCGIFLTRFAFNLVSQIRDRIKRKIDV